MHNINNNNPYREEDVILTEENINRALSLQQKRKYMIAISLTEITIMLLLVLFFDYRLSIFFLFSLFGYYGIFLYKGLYLIIYLAVKFLIMMTLLSILASQLDKQKDIEVLYNNNTIHIIEWSKVCILTGWYLLINLFLFLLNLDFYFMLPISSRLRWR